MNHYVILILWLAYPFGTTVVCDNMYACININPIAYILSSTIKRQIQNRNKAQLRISRQFLHYNLSS